jgi:hypothetical protein
MANPLGLNIIPADRVSRAANVLLNAFYPLPNYPSYTGAPNFLWQSSEPSGRRWHQQFQCARNFQEGEGLLFGVHITKPSIDNAQVPLVPKVTNPALYAQAQFAPAHGDFRSGPLIRT